MPFGTVTLSEYDEHGFLGVQVDALGDGGVPTMNVVHPLGSLARPHDPDDTGYGCTVDERRYGLERFAWLGDDPRLAEWIPQQNKGGRCWYGGPLSKSQSFIEIDGTTGSFTVYVPTAWDGTGLATAAHKVEVGVDGGGDPIAQLLHSDGSLLSLFDGAATLADSTGGGFVEVKGGKITLNGSTKVVGGLDVGGTGGVEVPLHPALAAAFNTFATTVASLPTGSMDGGALLKTGLATACGVLSSSLAAAKSTMLKTI